MKFSLVTGTVGRTVELDRLLDSLGKQSCQDFELIVADQNPDDRLLNRLRPYEGRFPIVHLQCSLGASRARNAGLGVARGSIISFPDDDCWYPEDLLEKVADFFLSNPGFDGLTGRCVDRSGEDSVGRYVKEEGLVSLRDLFRKATAVTMFFTRESTRKVPGFDEDVGPGAETIYQGAEDLQYLIRLLKAGCRVFYSPRILVYHENPTVGYSPAAAQRGYSYGCGLGRVLRQEGYPRRVMAGPLIRPLGGAIVSLATGRLQKGLYHFAVFRGRLRGWLDASPDGPSGKLHELRRQ
jgi:glycosyltransferase involved in cell wall biosynthesis